MGDLFDDFPDLARMPTRVYTLMVLAGGAVVPVCMIATVSGLCPAHKSHSHPPHENHAPMSARVLASAVMGSTSTV